MPGDLEIRAAGLYGLSVHGVMEMLTYVSVRVLGWELGSIASRGYAEFIRFGHSSNRICEERALCQVQTPYV